MRISSLKLLGLITCFTLMLGISVLVSLPIAAQGIFATNTPEGLVTPVAESTTGDGLFATNTPSGFGIPSPTVAPTSDSVPFGATNTPQGGIPTVTPMPTATPIGPQQPIDQYALKLWLEGELVDYVLERIEVLQDGATEDEILALQLALYEMERRVPGAPRTPQLRQRLVEVMLSAPVGTIGMRSVVRPFIVDAINAQTGGSEFNINGFVVTLETANLDGRAPRDAVARITYTDADTDTVLYDDYILLVGNEGGGYSLPPTTYDLFAAPFGDVNAIQLLSIVDSNRDTLDEVVLSVDDGQPNTRLLILGVRNNTAIDLALPPNEIRYVEIGQWLVNNPDIDNPPLEVVTAQQEGEAPYWQCLSEQPVTWTYDRNFYRPSTGINAQFVYQDSLACTLLEAEPLFALPPEEAIELVEDALLDYGFDAPSGDRALLTLGMLYALQGRLDDARNTAQSVIPVGDTESWTFEQASALIEATNNPNNTALDICDALARRSEQPACDMNAVIGRFLGLVEDRLDTTQPLETQLNNVGLPVLQSVEVSEVGRSNRTAILFSLTGSDWWGFAAQRDGSYQIEPAAPPAGFEAATAPIPRLNAPQGAYDALLVDDAPQGVLDILANLERSNPDQPFTADALYLRALAYDLVGNRTNARQEYYNTWQRFPENIWGRQAQQHLELR